jgi:hypothetical protein
MPLRRSRQAAIQLAEGLRRVELLSGSGPPAARETLRSSGMRKRASAGIDGKGTRDDGPPADDQPDEVGRKENRIAIEPPIKIRASIRSSKREAIKSMWRERHGPRSRVWPLRPPCHRPQV